MGKASDKPTQSLVKSKSQSEILGQRPNPSGSNLRDFRIDDSSVPELSTPRGFASTQFSESAIPRQTVVSRARASSMSEWTDESDDVLNATSGQKTDSESLWGDWKEELQQVAKQPSAKASPEPTQAKPAEPPIAEDEIYLRGEDLREPSWSAELALAERKAEREGYVDFSNSYQKQEMLKNRTLEFLQQLQKSFREQVEIFNQHRKSPAHSIQVYRVSKTAGDFMLFRNGVKLVVSGQRAGRVLFAFNQYLGQIFSPTQNPSLEIEAEWGPFDQLFWSYKSERVQTPDVVRYFLLEFVNQSFK
jgi:hypothetical protein